MRKLFFSLYLAVTVGLFVINGTTEWLWQELSDTQPQNKWRESYAQLITHLHRNNQLEEIGEHVLTGKVTIAPVSHFAFLPEQIESLQAGRPVHLYDEQGLLYFYLPKQQDSLWQIGPLDLDEQDGTSVTGLQNGLLFLSYLLLALLIFMWSRPLWRDLNRLKRQNRAFGELQKIEPSQIHPSSVLYSLAESQHKMANKISELMSLQKQMTHAVSHDIRTPLARLKFSLAILDNQGDANLRQQSHQEMLTDVEEIEALVDEMLTYGRLETDQTPLSYEVVNVSELLDNLIDKLKVSDHIHVQKDIPNGLKLLCDGHYLERAIQNLLTNAIRHAESVVRVSLSKENGLSVWVEDDGSGIAETEREKIWTPFTRLDTSRNRAKGGFGLGLAIVAKIIEWHKGEVEVTDSQLGGACFNIRLPG